MAYKVIILYRLYMPSYVLGTFTEYPKSDKKEYSRERVFLLFHGYILLCCPHVKASPEASFTCIVSMNQREGAVEEQKGRS